MPLINASIETKKEKVTIEISNDILSKINDYCKWAKLKDIGFFLEESAKLVFKKDKEYKANFATPKRKKKAKETETV